MMIIGFLSPRRSLRVYLLKANVTSLDGTKYAEVITSLTVVDVSANQQLLIEYIMDVALVITVGGLFYEQGNGYQN